MRKYFLLACLLLTLGVGRVAAQSGKPSFDGAADFSKYKTFKWVNIDHAQHLDELTADQLMGTIEVQLATKGLTKPQSENVDLYIGYQIAGGKGHNLSFYNFGAPNGPAPGAPAGSTGAASTTVHTGELVLDIYDAAKKQLVWRGSVAHAIDADAKPDKKQKHMDRAVEKLLKDYPPRIKP
jgi:Domain of unknown function (DUF4136)